jgi:phospholipid/cholesterol/gamma-HCH transport system substrate-binding protein
VAETVEDTEQEGGAARLIAAGAVALVAVGVAIVLLAAPDPYRVKAHFQAAGQLHEGNVVQTAGKRVGVVKHIELTDDGRAEVEMELDDTVAPLRQGTTATIRQSSQSSAAGRYIDLQLAPAGAQEIPDGGLIEYRLTTTQVDIDQLFALFDEKTRKGLRNVFRGSASQYVGRGEQANIGWHYLNPSLRATTRRPPSSSPTWPSAATTWPR